MSRISIRILINQHSKSFSQSTCPGSASVCSSTSTVSHYHSLHVPDQHPYAHQPAQGKVHIVLQGAYLGPAYISHMSLEVDLDRHSRNQTTLLFGKKPVSNNTRHIGSIDPQCDVMDVVQDAYENARFLCDQYYLSSPELIVKQNSE
uniref:Protein-serine/threonine kinase n=1 Tax=Timema shepardi TaxID=629360 RepID=A0A7R9G8P1_TIMSH|nr:unnamed protein product [Timema shepardi]